MLYPLRLFFYIASITESSVFITIINKQLEYRIKEKKHKSC